MGKVYFDVRHSLKDHKSNRTSHLPSYAAWKIHPVMKLRIPLLTEDLLLLRLALP